MKKEHKKPGLMMVSAVRLGHDMVGTRILSFTCSLEVLARKPIKERHSSHAHMALKSGSSPRKFLDPRRLVISIDGLIVSSTADSKNVMPTCELWSTTTCQ